MKKDKEKALRKEYNFVVNHFSNERYNLVLQVFKQIYASNKQLLSRKQFAQCSLQCRVLKELLIKDGFSEKDIKTKRKFIGLGFHYYLLVNVNGKIWKVDPFFKKIQKIITCLIFFCIFFQRQGELRLQKPR